MGTRLRKSLLAALAASATCVVLAYGVNTYWQRAPLYVGEEAGILVPTPNPTPTLFVPADMRPALRAVAGDRAAVYGDGCHLDAGEVHAKECIYGDAGAPRVVWFGDSHAAQWFPALLGWAEESGMAVESHTKSSCAATMAQPVLNGVEYWQCEAWRAEVLQRIVDDPPELVVISNLAETNGQGSADDLGYWEEGLGEFVGGHPRAGRGCCGYAVLRLHAVGVLVGESGGHTGLCEGAGGGVVPESAGCGEGCGGEVRGGVPGHERLPVRGRVCAGAGGRVGVQGWAPYYGDV